MDALQEALEHAKAYLDVAVSFNRLGRRATTQMQYVKSAETYVELAHKLLTERMAKEKEL